MTETIPPLDQAQDEARAARERLAATAQVIQSRLEPANLLEDALTDVKARSAEMVRVAGEQARQRPATIAAAAIAGLALLAHRPLWRLGRKITGRSRETDEGSAS
ncbi:MAG: hypothetical protein JWO65_272 [Sphingomonas bacterium]|jgi:ElaB/YqjD/DUF883 family membrane-anchored ribosome-binding protein|nr:hypothetical protein [Sphingomonas bacterium]